MVKYSKYTKCPECDSDLDEEQDICLNCDWFDKRNQNLFRIPRSGKKEFECRYCHGTLNNADELGWHEKSCKLNYDDPSHLLFKFKNKIRKVKIIKPEDN